MLTQIERERERERERKRERVREREREREREKMYNWLMTSDLALGVNCCTQTKC